MISFAKDIQPLFRDKDVEAMSAAFDLSDYGDVKDNAPAIYKTVANGSMPCDGPWPQETVALFKRWMDEGMQP